MADATVADQLYEAMSSLWMEAIFLVFFPLGFAFFRRRLKPKGPQQAKKLTEWADEARFSQETLKAFETEASSGTPEGVLRLWNEHKGKALQLDVLRHAVQAFLTAEKANLVPEVTTHMDKFGALCANPRHAAALLDVVARAGDMKLMEDLAKAFRDDLNINCNILCYEVLVGGYATQGNLEKVESLLAEMKRERITCSPRAHSLIMKGFLKNSMIDPVVLQMKAMQAANLQVPSFAVTQLFRVCAENGRNEELFYTLREAKVPVNADAALAILDDMAKRNRGDSFVRDLEEHLRSEGPLSQKIVEACLRIYASAADKRALDLFVELRTHGPVSEGLCVGLLARCAEAKFMRFAEEIVKVIREENKMSISMYSAFMKVYAYSGMYDKACDLYDMIVADGMTPDSMMYGCLMKFAVECGRTDLSRKLADLAPELDIQSYMSLIRAAGRDKDVDSAFKVLQRLRISHTAPDLAVYNCVLDVCVIAGDMRRAEQLVKDVKKEVGNLDIISYNTLLKGYCMSRKLDTARALLQEMRSVGVQPNDVSYNCIINAYVSEGRFDDAWELVDSLRANGVAPDHFTISIMMKSLKKTKRPQDANRALELLDEAGIDVCSDEILLNTVLEMCIRMKELRRLETFLDIVVKSRTHPSIHTYGTLIKGSGLLKRVDQCWSFWRRLVDDHGSSPNCVVLGCMLDALVSNGKIDDAMALLDKWSDTVQPNAVIYSTLVKGYAANHQADKALKLLHKMRKEGVQMNTIAYNAAIDSQARVGAMTAVYELLDNMEKDGCQPDSITHSTVVKGFCISGDLDKAFSVFETMQDSGMTNESIIYNTLLDGCIRHNRMDLADKVLEDLQRREITPTNFTLGILVKMYGRRGKLEEAFQVVSDWPKKFHFSPNAQVWTCLMCACIHSGDTDRAMQVFEKTKGLGMADSRAYGALLAGLGRLGQFDKAIPLLLEAYGLPVQPGQKRRQAVELDKECLEQMMTHLRQHGQMEKLGLKLVEELRHAGVQVSSRALSSAMGHGGERREKGKGGGKGGGKYK